MFSMRQSYMSAPCQRNVVLPVGCWLILVDLIPPKGLKGHYLQHLQCLAVQSIHVLDGVHLQSESAIPA